MIAINLRGGLGNQMFQYAAGLSLAKKNNCELLMDTSWFENIDPKDTMRKYELDCFLLDQNIVDKADIELAGEMNRLGLVLNRIKKSNYFTEYVETSTRFDKKFYSLKGNVYLVGYFQSEKYFKEIRPELLHTFSFKDKPNLKNKQIIENANSQNSISIHVRRGDYVSNKNSNKFHGVQGLDYYKKAIKLIESKIKEPHYFVFSDDIEWCKKNLLLVKNATFVSNSRGSDDLRIMIECKHNIIANSSFSWWGAWLGSNGDKMVVAPMNWFKSKEADSSDIIPSRWQRI